MSRSVFFPTLSEEDTLNYIAHGPTIQVVYSSVLAISSRIQNQVLLKTEG